MLNIMKSAIRALLIMSFFGLIGSCGGSGSALVGSDNNSNSSSSTSSSGGPTIEPDPDNVQSISLLVRGLSGSLVISTNGVQRTQTRNGSVVIGNLPLGEIPVTLVSNPDQQQCLFESTSSASANLSENSETAVITCSDLLTLTGVIYEAGTQNPLSGVSASMRAFDSNGNLLVQQTDITGNDGVYLLENIQVGEFDRVVLSIEHDQYDLFSLPIAESPSTLYVEQNYSLSSAKQSATFDPTSSQNLVLGDVEIDISANSLRTNSGDLPSGNVTVFVSSLDASFAPELLPGGYISAGNEALQNYGAASVRFFSGTEELVFTSGAAATVRFPAAVRADGAPPNGAVHYYDRETGFWVATTAASMPTIGVYELSVNQSTVWGVFDSYPTVMINGCVRDAEGYRVADTLIITQGLEYIGRLLEYTDEYGNFSIGAKANSSVFLYARSDVASRTISVDTQSDTVLLQDCLIVDPNTTTVTLTWGEAPSDLDTHLIGPNGSGGTFHIYYSNKNETVGSGVRISLDVDDINSYGPEVTTIPRFPAAGTYSYYVHNFTRSGSMLASPTRIALFTGQTEYVYFIDEEPSTTCWHVFDIEVNSSLEPSVIVAGESVSPSTYCLEGP